LLVLNERPGLYYKTNNPIAFQITQSQSKFVIESSKEPASKAIKNLPSAYFAPR
jgi:hypothetical protein